MVFAIICPSPPLSQSTVDSYSSHLTTISYYSANEDGIAGILNNNF